jgi:hypothetical protein
MSFVMDLDPEDLRSCKKGSKANNEGNRLFIAHVLRWLKNKKIPQVLLRIFEEQEAKDHQSDISLQLEGLRSVVLSTSPKLKRVRSRKALTNFSRGISNDGGWLCRRNGRKSMEPSKTSCPKVPNPIRKQVATACKSKTSFGQQL